MSTNYCTLDEARQTIGLTDGLDDALIEACIATASRRIDSYCGRYFYQDAAATTAVFTPEADLITVYVDDISTTTGLIDDISTTTGLIVETAIDGATWSARTTYELTPVNGTGPNGQRGWPYTSLRLVGNFFYQPFPYYRQNTVRVTAQWGWAAVPDDVKMACRLLAHQIYRSKDVPFGATGTDGIVVFVKANPLVANLLDPFRRGEAFGGMA